MVGADGVGGGRRVPAPRRQGLGPESPGRFLEHPSHPSSPPLSAGLQPHPVLLPSDPARAHHHVQACHRTQGHCTAGGQAARGHAATGWEGHEERVAAVGQVLGVLTWEIVNLPRVGQRDISPCHFTITWKFETSCRHFIRENVTQKPMVLYLKVSVTN